MKNISLVEITPEELADIVRINTKKTVEPLIEQLDRLEHALHGQSPALDREMAAKYCGRSVGWIDLRREHDNLPSHKVGGSPYFKRSHLDHLLRGGKFDEQGVPLIPQKETS